VDFHAPTGFSNDIYGYSGNAGERTLAESWTFNYLPPNSTSKAQSTKEDNRIALILDIRPLCVVS